MTQIIWVLSFMKADLASQWAQRELELKAQRGTLQFMDWQEFEMEFRKDFTLLNAKATAVNTLEGNLHFQGKHSVNDYLDQFCDLIYDSRYTDQKTIVVKFQRGLDCCISSAIGMMAAGRPTDADSEDWFSLAI